MRKTLSLSKEPIPSIPAPSKHISWLKLRKIDNAHRVEWRWFSPDGNLHDSYANQISKPSGSPWEWYNVYSFIPIAGYVAAKMPGNWHVDGFIDGQKVLTEQIFTTSHKTYNTLRGVNQLNAGRMP